MAAYLNSTAKGNVLPSCKQTLFVLGRDSCSSLYSKRYDSRTLDRKFASLPLAAMFARCTATAAGCYTFVIGVTTRVCYGGFNGLAFSLGFRVCTQVATWVKGSLKGSFTRIYKGSIWG